MPFSLQSVFAEMVSQAWKDFFSDSIHTFVFVFSSLGAILP